MPIEPHRGDFTAGERFIFCMLLSTRFIFGESDSASKAF
jgi:hypothetical protein